MIIIKPRTVLVRKNMLRRKVVSTGVAGADNNSIETAVKQPAQKSGRLKRKKFFKCAAAANVLGQKVSASLPKNITACMRRIIKLHRSGAYLTSGYSKRSLQRHRQQFLEIGIDLRVPYQRLPAPAKKIGLPPPSLPRPTCCASVQVTRPRPRPRKSRKKINSPPTIYGFRSNRKY